MHGFHGQKGALFFGLQNHQRGFLLPLPDLGNFLTEVAGMFAVKGLGHRLRHGSAPGIINHHLRPRHGLEYGPRTTHHQKQGQRNT